MSKRATQQRRARRQRAAVARPVIPVAPTSTAIRPGDSRILRARLPGLPSPPRNESLIDAVTSPKYGPPSRYKRPPPPRNPAGAARSGKATAKQLLRPRNLAIGAGAAIVAGAVVNSSGRAVDPVNSRPTGMRRY